MTTRISEYSDRYGNSLKDGDYLLFPITEEDDVIVPSDVFKDTSVYRVVDVQLLGGNGIPDYIPAMRVDSNVKTFLRGYMTEKLPRDEKKRDEILLLRKLEGIL